MTDTQQHIYGMAFIALIVFVSGLISSGWVSL